MDNERSWSAWLLGGLLVAAIIGAVVYIFVAAQSRPTAAQYEVGARAWAQRMGIEVTGVDCNGFGYCTFARGGDAPFLASCDGDHCIMQVSK